MYTKLLLLLAFLVIPFGVAEAAYEQEFIITAYYSPQPGQCCYATGGYESDKVLNGQGHTSADGTAVYPGMIAAPSLYAFGTRITLPDYGVFTVHDRGGAIVDLGNGVHRLDIWVGAGEEGLARALAFGVQRIRGVVHPLGSTQPEEQYIYSAFPGPPARLADYAVHKDLMSIQPEREEKSYSVILLQNALHTLGYFTHSITGYFGEKTQESMLAFLGDAGLHQPAHKLTERTASYILAALHRKDAPSPLTQFIDGGASKAEIAKSQRLLRFLGFYRGRTHGIYDHNLKSAIFAFQQSHHLVTSQEELGAGRIGPATNAVLEREWNKKLNAKKAKQYIAIGKIKKTLNERNQHIASFMEQGSHGQQVRLLQEFLTQEGYFPAGKANGNFGPLTQQAVLSYQLARGIVQTENDTGAGTVGPMTLMQLREEQETALFRKVNASGWAVL